MLKRKYLHRNDWSRVTHRRYTEKKVEDNTFQGYISLIEMVDITEPLFVTHLGKTICLVDRGYSWLQQLPTDTHYGVTTIFDEAGQIVQWYIDITYNNGIDERGPYMDDLFLDILVFPTGEVLVEDAHELQEALDIGRITAAQYDLAYEVCDELLAHLKHGTFWLKEQSVAHREQLLTHVS